MTQSEVAKRIASARKAPGFATDWSINQYPQPGGRISVGAPGTPIIAIVPTWHISINQQLAYATLIAAAPQLLAALELALDTLEDVLDMDTTETALRTTCREALAKANGQQAPQPAPAH
jgi:hypothetical protein